MPHTELLLYQEEDGSVPVLEWLRSLPAQAQDRCLVRLERLEEVGRSLRRPEADYLRDGIYELRIRVRNVHYRMLYFFYGSHVAVVAHGLAKQGVVPPRDIDTAMQRRARVLARPTQHLFRPEGGAR